MLALNFGIDEEAEQWFPSLVLEDPQHCSSWDVSTLIQMHFKNALHPHQRFQEFTKVSHPHWMLEDFLNLLTGRVKRHESSLGWHREARHNTFLMLFLWHDHFVSKISQHLLLRSGQVTVPCVSKGAFTFALIACSGRGFDCSPFPARLCSFYMMCVRTPSRLHNQSATYVARERLWGKH